MSYKLNPQEAGNIRLNESDVVESVLQNIAILLTTRQQSVPMHRAFGLPMNFLDKPINVAKNLMIAEIYEAIKMFEPRATIVAVTFAADDSRPGTLIPIVEVDINEQ